MINWFIDLFIDLFIDWLFIDLFIDWLIDCTPGCEVVPDVNIQQCRYGIKLSVPSTDGMSDIWLRCENESQYAQVRITPPPPFVLVSFWVWIFDFSQSQEVRGFCMVGSNASSARLTRETLHMLQPTLHGAKTLIKTTAKSFNLPLSHPSSQICLPLCFFFAPLKFFCLSYGKIITPSSLHIFLEILVVIF